MKNENSLVNDPYLDIQTTGRLCGGLSHWTIRGYFRDGYMQKTKIGGRTMVRQSEVERFIREGLKKPIVEPTEQESKTVAPKTPGRRTKLAAMLAVR